MTIKSPTNKTIGSIIIRTTVLLALVSIVFLSISSANDEDSARADVKSLTPHQVLQLAIGGSASAQYELGLRYEYGRGVSQDDVSAVYWYKQSATQEFVNAQYRLAILYDNGWGTAPDKQKALTLYRTAAEKGHTMAQHDLAIMYFEGSEAPRSPLQAYKWLKIAVVGGNPLMEKHLRMIATEMSEDEVKTAEYLANEWLGTN